MPAFVRNPDGCVTSPQGDLHHRDTENTEGHRGAKISSAAGGIAVAKPLWRCAEHARQLGSESLLFNLMEVKN
jgi:hypothetical protein